MHPLLNLCAGRNRIALNGIAGSSFSFFAFQHHPTLLGRRIPEEVGCEGGPHLVTQEDPAEEHSDRPPPEEVGRQGRSGQDRGDGVQAEVDGGQVQFGDVADAQEEEQGETSEEIALPTFPSRLQTHPAKGHQRSVITCIRPGHPIATLHRCPCRFQLFPLPVGSTHPCPTRWRPFPSHIGPALVAGQSDPVNAFPDSSRALCLVKRRPFWYKAGKGGDHGCQEGSCHSGRETPRAPA